MARSCLERGRTANCSEFASILLREDLVGARRPMRGGVAVRLLRGKICSRLLGRWVLALLQNTKSQVCSRNTIGIYFLFLVHLLTSPVGRRTEGTFSMSLSSLLARWRSTCFWLLHLPRLFQSSEFKVFLLLLALARQSDHVLLDQSQVVGDQSQESQWYSQPACSH